VDNIDTYVYAKFGNNRLRSETALTDCKSDNNNTNRKKNSKNNTRAMLVAIGDPSIGPKISVHCPTPAFSLYVCVCHSHGFNCYQIARTVTQSLLLIARGVFSTICLTVYISRVERAHTSVVSDRD